MSSGTSDLIARFLDYIAFERGLAANTRIAYEYDLRVFTDFLKRHYGLDDFTAVTRDHIAAFLADERKLGYASATRVRQLAAIRVLFGWLEGENLVPVNITSVIATPARERRLPHVVSEDEMRTLLDSVNGTTRYNIRDRALLETLYACGLRVSECAHLTLSDVRLSDALVRCRGKGDKQRLIPIGETASAWLRRYLEAARPLFMRHADPKEQTVFLTNRGGPFTREGIYLLLAARARDAGIASHLSPHVLRHCFASHLLAHGAQIRAIQEMLGHADIATTQIYTHVDAAALLRTHALFHPRH